MEDWKIVNILKTTYISVKRFWFTIFRMKGINVKSIKSITVNDSQLPVDLLPLTSVIHENKVYSVGKYMSCV